MTAPVLLFDGHCPRCTRTARWWWQLVARDRYEIRPAAQLGLAPPRPHGLDWLDDDGHRWGGAGALSEAMAHGDRRVVGRLGDPRGRAWARVLPWVQRVLAHR